MPAVKGVEAKAVRIVVSGGVKIYGYNTTSTQTGHSSQLTELCEEQPGCGSSTSNPTRPLVPAHTVKHV